MSTWKVGEIVALVPRDGSSNGAGDGILWRVTKLVHNLTFPGSSSLQGVPRVDQVRVEPVWTATGSTSLRSKTVRTAEIRQRIGFARLGELRMQLDELCREALKLEAGIEEPGKEIEG